MVITLVEIADSSLSLLHYSLILPLLAMQSTVFRHYVPSPSGQKYYIQYTLPTTTTTPPQVHTSQLSNGVHDGSFRYIKPAPAIPTAASSSQGGTPGQMPQVKFVHYSPR